MKHPAQGAKFAGFSVPICVWVRVCLFTSSKSPSWYSNELLRVSGQVLGILLGIPSSFMVFDKASWYSLKALG